MRKDSGRSSLSKVGLCGFVGLTVLLTLGASGEERPGRTLSVTGEALVRVVPDEAALILEVQSKKPQLAAARQDNDERVRALLQVARAQGVEERDLQTSNIEIEPRWRRSSKTEEDIFLGYRVSKTLSLVLRDLPHLEVLLAALLEGGADQIRSVQFQTSEIRKHRDEARRLAAQAAREKGAALATELGARLGPVISIQEGGRFGRGWNASLSANTTTLASGAGAGSGTVAAGEIEIRASVSVVFELEIPDARVD